MQIMIRPILLLLLTLLGGTTLYGQTSRSSDPLGAKTIFPRLGLYGALDRTEMTGGYVIGCGVFDGGEGTNIQIGASIDYDIADRFRIDGLVGFRTRNVAGRYTTVEESAIQTADGFVETPITYEHVGALNSSYLFLQPGLSAYPLDWLYVGAGVNAQLALGGNMQYSRDIVSKVVTLDDGRVVEAFYPLSDSPEPHTRRFPEEEPTGRTSLLIDPVFFLGAEFTAWRDYFIGPRITYSLPVMQAIEDPAAELSSLSVGLIIRRHLR